MGNNFSCDEKQILRRMIFFQFPSFFFMNMEIATQSIYRITHNRSSRYSFLATKIVKTLMRVTNHKVPPHKPYLRSL